MMKRFWVFILLTFAAGVVSAQDMPPLPSDAPASAAPAKDAGMPALPDSSAAPAAAPAAATSSNDMPALPDAGAAPAKAAAAGTNDMPALPDAGAAAAPAATAAKTDAKGAAASDMPALPDAGGTAAPAKSAAPAASSDMPALPGDNNAAAPAAAPQDAAPPSDADMNAAPVDNGQNEAPKPTHEAKPWLASKERPKTIFGGWVKGKGGNITSRLSWASQQVLNAMDAKKYKMDKEEGVYEGEQNKGPQFRKFTFVVPKTQDTVFVLLKEVKGKIWLRVGPDEEPAPADHTYAQVAKIRAEDQKVLAIIKAKFGSRAMPHRYVPSWDAPFDRHKETADE